MMIKIETHKKGKVLIQHTSSHVNLFLWAKFSFYGIPSCQNVYQVRVYSVESHR